MKASIEAAQIEAEKAAAKKAEEAKRLRQTVEAFSQQAGFEVKSFDETPAKKRAEEFTVSVKSTKELVKG